METLISYKNSYSDFKQSYQVQLDRAKGPLKRNIQYGKYYNLPVDSKKIVFYISNNDLKTESLLQVIESFAKFHMDQEYTIKILFGAQLDQNMIPENFQKYIQKPSVAKSQEDFATAKYILASTSLPKYFVRKNDQKVIRFLDEFDEKENTRLKLAMNQLSWFMNSSYIFIKDENGRKQLSENDYFMELKGIVSLFKEKLLQSKDQIIDGILNAKKEEKVTTKEKKHILIIISGWEDQDDEERYLRLITDNVDYDKKDIIVVMKRPESGYKEDIVQNLNKNVRIIYRQGAFPCSAEEYINIQYLLKNFDSFENVEKAYSKLDPMIVERESKRLFGNIEFEDVIYIGKHSSLWTIMSAYIPSKHKFRIETQDLLFEEQSCLTESKKRAFFNRMDLYCQALDKIVFPNLENQKMSVERKYLPIEKTKFFEFPTKIYQKSKKQYDVVNYLGNQYFVGEKIKYTYGGIRLDLFPLPNKNTVKYIASSIISDENVLIEMFCKLQEKQENSVLVVYGKQSSKVKELAKQYNFQDKVYLIEKERIDLVDRMEEYLQLFEGYLSTDNNGQYCPIKVGMELLGKDILIMKDKTIRKSENKQFRDEKSFEDFRQKKWNDFL